MEGARRPARGGRKRQHRGGVCVPARRLISQHLKRSAAAAVPIQLSPTPALPAAHSPAFSIVPRKAEQGASRLSPATAFISRSTERWSRQCRKKAGVGGGAREVQQQ